MTYVMAIDIGTGSGRAVIFNQVGQEVSAAQEEWWHHSDPRYPGAMNFAVEDNWALICRCIRQAVSKANIRSDEIVAVSASSMREAIVVFDESGQEIWACANVDGRASKQVADLKAQHSDLERDLYIQTGQTFALGALPRLMWLKEEEPELFERMRYVTMLSDWVAARLCGVIASEASNAGTTGLFGLAERQWLKHSISILGCHDFFPPVYKTGDVLGKVTAKASQETGLSEKTLIVSGGGDCQMATLGLGLVSPGECTVLGGTFWQQIVNVAPDVHDHEMNLRINPHVIEGVNQAEAISFFVGAVMRWFRDNFAQEELTLVDTPSDAYRLLEEKSALVPPGAYGVIPIFSDIMRYGKWMHAAPSFLNLSLDSERSGKAVLFRALQENACILAAENLRAVFELSSAKPEQIVFAAGASKSAHWSQMLSDVTGMRVVTSKVREATALGCAVAAGVGAGWSDSKTELAKLWFCADQVYEPDLSKASCYQDVAARWRDAYAAQLKLVEQGITTSMWRAPGV